MSSSYELCPAFLHNGGYLVIRRVEKAFPVFLRCSAAHFPLADPATTAMLRSAEVCADLDDFSAAAARLVSQPMLRPFDGGAPVLVYIARPGKEELFVEFADGLEQADDFKLLLTLPPAGQALALVFGDPALQLAGGDPTAAALPALDPTATAVNLRPASVAPPADPVLDPMPLTGPGDEMPTWTPADLDTHLLADPPIEADLLPLPLGPSQPALDADFLPPVEVVMSSASALNDVLRPTQPGGAEGAEPASTANDLSEPALEILLRQSPRLQSPDTEFGPGSQTAMEASRGPAPEEVLAAVRQVVGALDDALRRQTAEQNTALQMVIAATERAVEVQGRALEARQAEQWERQQAALRQMQADQAAAIEKTLVRLDEERSAWQQRALKELQQTSSQQMPGALRQLQDEQAARQQQALNQLREDLLKRAPAEAGPLASPAALQDLNWQLEKSAVSSQDLRLRVGQLLWVNLVLLLALIGLALGVFWLLRANLTPGPVPTPTAVAATIVAVVEPTALPPTPVPPTAVPSTATAAATATLAATALPAFLAALTCANTDRPRNFYECALSNSGPITDTLALAVQAADEELNGFRPLVLDADQSRVQADPITGLFSLGPLGPGETRQLRVLLPCAIATGCAETTFIITPLVDAGRTLITDQVVEVTTHYFPPDAPTAP